MVTSSDIKHELIKYLCFEKRHLIACTESLNLADVLTLTSTRFLLEHEIKVSKSDLVGELKAIKVAQQDMSKFTLWPEEMQDLSRKVSDSKLYKHRRYLGTYYNRYGLSQLKYYRPNRFLFVVPEPLGDVAAQGVAGTPYGVITVSGNQWREIANFTTLVKARPLHTEKVEESNFLRMVRRVGVENITMREKLLTP